MSTVVILTIILALLFDFLNGMNDAGNSIATLISTRILTPRLGVLWAAVFNIIGAFAFGVGVATTIGKGIVDPYAVKPLVIMAALIGSMIWTYNCTRLGIPSSVSHSLIGGLCGAAVMKSGLATLNIAGIAKIAVFIVVAPLMGMVVSAVMMILLSWIVKSWSKMKVEKAFSKLQLLSSAAFSVSHGTNDAQKTMGIISILLFSAGILGKEFYVPWWVILACTLCIGLGTLAGGWKVIRTMGTKLTNLRPLGGSAAETGGAITVIGASLAGIPVSTTHTITGCIIGVGIQKNVGAVRWGMASNIVLAWVFTIPAAAVGGALFYYILSKLGL